MAIKQKMGAGELDKYSFLWSEVRLLLAAVALFVGGVPVLYSISPASATFGILGTLLRLCWVVSGATALYLGYRWFKKGKTLFGKKNKPDLYAFAVTVISGVNLGIVGLGGGNIGMNLSSNKIVFIVVGVAYVWSAWQLWKSWNKGGKRVF